MFNKYFHRSRSSHVQVKIKSVVSFSFHFLRQVIIKIIIFIIGFSSSGFSSLRESFPMFIQNFPSRQWRKIVIKVSWISTFNDFSTFLSEKIMENSSQSINFNARGHNDENIWIIAFLYRAKERNIIIFWCSFCFCHILCLIIWHLIFVN